MAVDQLKDYLENGNILNSREPAQHLYGPGQRHDAALPDPQKRAQHHCHVCRQPAAKPASTLRICRANPVGSTPTPFWTFPGRSPPPPDGYAAGFRPHCEGAGAALTCPTAYKLRTAWRPSCMGGLPSFVRMSERKVPANARGLFRVTLYWGAGPSWPPGCWAQQHHREAYCQYMGCTGGNNSMVILARYSLRSKDMRINDTAACQRTDARHRAGNAGKSRR